MAPKGEKKKIHKGEKGEEAGARSIETDIEKLKVTITKALCHSLYELDESSRAIVLRKAGAACAQAVRAMRKEAGLEYPTGVDLDTACEFINRAALYDQRVQRSFICKKDGDTVEIRDSICDLLGGCSCILVLAGLIEPNASLCRICQEGHWMDHLEYMTGQRPDKVECPESHTQGQRDCVARCHFKSTK